MKPVYKILFLLLVFSIAMGFMESAVVVYLRSLYYPDGFIFPLVPLENRILLTELLREASTLIMLLTIAIIAGKNFAQRFAFFLFCFAIWDIFYYIFLYFLLGWPASLLDWDILFLLPVPWVGPVLAPCLLSITMIIYTLTIIYLQVKGFEVKIKFSAWLLMIAGSLIVILSFTIDYIRIIFATPIIDIMERLIKYTPQSYNWLIFIAGEVLLMAAIVKVFERARRLKL
ncbi:MAG: hypothetical protein K0B15_11070 [Lentimicrobium sp.]|nr:hypothetical protein [Lentimicrobium sp.]